MKEVHSFVVIWVQLVVPKLVSFLNHRLWHDLDIRKLVVLVSSRVISITHHSLQVIWQGLIEPGLLMCARSPLLDSWGLDNAVIFGLIHAV